MTSLAPLGRKHLFGRGLLVAASLIFTVAALEAGARFVQWRKYGAGPSVYQFTTDPTSGLRVPVPGETRGSRVWIRINSLGFRGPELELPKPAARIRLAFLGASTTFCAEVSRDEMTWPHLVWNHLQAAHPSVSFDYMNAAVPGYGVEESRRNLEYRVAPLSPDVIVIYHATNDLSYDTRRLAEAKGLSRRQPTKQSWLADWSLAWFLVEKNLHVVARQRAAARGADRLTFDPQQISRRFQDKLTELVVAARHLAPVVALATFSHKVRRDQPHEQQLRAANTALYYMPNLSVHGLLAGYEEYNPVIREVSRQTDVLLIDNELGIPGDDRHFHDSVHFTDLGSRRMARRVAESLVASERFSAFISSRTSAPATAGDMRQPSAPPLSRGTRLQDGRPVRPPVDPAGHKGPLHQAARRQS